LPKINAVVKILGEKLLSVVEMTAMPGQWGNVGNAGDTLKQAPIPDLIDVLVASSRRVAYFDPFAFALDAPLSPMAGYARWRNDLEARRCVRPAYGRLLDLQGPRLEVGGSYRCGIGMALDAIGSNRLLWLHAGESDEDLRASLEAGLEGMGLAAALLGGVVLPDASQSPAAIARAHASVEAGDGLFTLIDPFTIRGSPWQPVLEGLALALRPGAQAIALIYTFGDHDWPSDLSPVDALCRIRRVREGPHQSAAFATQAVADGVARVLDRFAWTRADRILHGWTPIHHG
jgi:hypothetical protein